MATTTNYGWTTPDDTALVKDGASAIRTLGSSVDTTTKALNPSTTLGDIEYRSSTANTNTRLAIGTTGQVLTVAAGVPSWAAPAGGSTFAGVRLTISANQSCANNTGTMINWDTENYDTDAFHSTSTNTSRITIPAGKAGYYSISATGAFSSNSTGQRYFAFYKNGSFEQIFGRAAGYSADTVLSGTVVLNLAVGDYIQIEAFQNSGGALNFESTISSQFSAQYLGA